MCCGSLTWLPSTGSHFQPSSSVLSKGESLQHKWVMSRCKITTKVFPEGSDQDGEGS